MGDTITGVVIGAGDRGIIYGNHSLENPDKLKIVAVAEPRTLWREEFGNIHKIPHDQRYETWEELLSQGRIADLAIITTPDHLHYRAAIMAMEKGYDILLEKPMATTQEECIDLVKTAKEHSVNMQIGYILRYTEFFSQIKSIIEDRTIGDIVTISLRENVSYYHYAHSFIRGNWRNRDQSSPMILAKSSHDLDILQWLVGSTPKMISSFGKLTHFGLINKPEGAPDRCLDGCPVSETCLYYAPRIYLDLIPILHIAKKGGTKFEQIASKIVLKYPFMKKVPFLHPGKNYNGWPVNVISKDPSMDARYEALKSGPFGRCVYAVEDHNVVDHQTVMIEFDNEVTATFTMHGHSSEEGRTIRIDGTRGTIVGKFMHSGNKLTVIDTLTNTEDIIMDTGVILGHGGGDEKLIEEYINYLIDSTTATYTGTEDALISHLMAFAVDQSRLQQRSIDFKQFMELGSI